MMKKLRYKYYNERITFRDNGNVQYHDQEEPLTVPLSQTVVLIHLEMPK